MHKTWAGVLFLLAVAAVLTFPLWYSHARGATEAEPVVLPTGGDCVEPADVMRRRHMELLYDWRDSVVRGTGAEHRRYVNSKGIVFEKSLSGTCLGCHESRRTFCDRCHERASVTITCFQCHPSVGSGPGGVSPEGSHDHH